MESFEIKDIVKHFVGQANTVAIPAIFKKWLGSYNLAVLFGQILYWNDRTDNPEGWFYKSYKEWEAEIYLTEKETRNALDRLLELGLIETKLAKINGSPVKHFRLKSEQFHRLFTGFLAKERERLNSEQSLQVVENKGANGILPKGRMESYQRADSLSSQNLLTKNNIHQPRARDLPHSQSGVQSLPENEMPAEPSEKLRYFPFLERQPMPAEKLSELAELFSFIAACQNRTTLIKEQDWLDLCISLEREGMSVEGIKSLYRYCKEVLKMNPVTPKVMNWKLSEYREFFERQTKPKPQITFNPNCFRIESNPLPEGYA